MALRRKEGWNWDPPGHEATALPFALQHLRGEVDSSRALIRGIHTLYGEYTCDKMADLMFRMVSK